MYELDAAVMFFLFVALFTAAWKCTVRTQCTIQLFVLLTSVCALPANETTLDAVSEFTWFTWAKRVSLVVGLLATVALSVWRQSTYVVVFAQFILWANVFEAGLLAVESQEYAIGLALIVLSFFPPHFYVDDMDMLCATSAADQNRNPNQEQEQEEGGKQETETGIPNAVFWCVCGKKPWRSPLSVKWYMRCHYILLASFYILGSPLASLSLAVLVTALFPLLLTEGERLLFGSVSEVRFFMARVVALVSMVFIATFVNDDFYTSLNRGLGWPNLSTDNSLVQNVAEVALTLPFFAGCWLIDRRIQIQKPAPERSDPITLETVTLCSSAPRPPTKPGMDPNSATE